MKRVLVVDDEPAILFGLSESLSDKVRGITVVTAADGQEAVTVLEAKKVDLVLTDLRMPEVDGFELLTYLRRNFPHLPVILMTGYGPAELARLERYGDLECFSKPIDMPSLRRRIGEMLAQRVKGKVENITLASFLQLLEMERKTCTLGVTSGERKGQLFFRGGRLIGAEVEEGPAGQEAAFEIVTWEQADIEISDVCPPIEPSIEGGLQFLLMEGMRLKDEQERGPSLSGAGSPGNARGGAHEEDEADANAALDDLLAAALPEGLESLGAPDELAGKIRDGLERAKDIDGSLGTLLVETSRGIVIGAAGASDEVDLEAVAMSIAQLLRSRQLLAASAKPADALEEATVTSGHRHHLVRVLGGGGFFLLLVLDRPAANLALARLQLAGVERDLGEHLPALAAAAPPPGSARGARRKPRK